MRMRVRLPIAAAIAVIALSAQSAGAADPGTVPQVSPRKACMHDYWKFCKGVPPLTKWVRSCLMKHMDGLTDQCRTIGFRAEVAADGG